MKKLFFTISLLFLCFISLAQNPLVGWYVATPTTPFGRTVTIGQFVMVQSTGGIYQIIKQNQLSTATVASVKVLGSLYYKNFNPAVDGAITPTTVVATTKVSSPIIYCSGATGAVFTATDGTTHLKLVLTPGGTATYVTVTAP